MSRRWSFVPWWRQLRGLERIAVLCWSAALVAIFLRIAFTPQRNTVFTTYEIAGASWLHGAALYTNYRGFVYSPLVAAFFAPFTLLPAAVSDILWRLLNVAVYLGALVWWLRAGLHSWISRERWAVVFLLILPLSIGNLNNGQINPLIIGLIMIALLAVRAGRWNLAAFCLAFATYCKIYPLAAGLILMLLFPKKFAWRLVAALVILGALSFILQKPAYVLEQYRVWFATRAGDDRKLYKMDIAPRDLWMLLRLAHISIGAHFYTAIQVLSGAAVALVCWLGRRRSWPPERLFVALLSLVCVWMLLCGPATESATYVLLAPALTLALVQAFSQPQPGWSRCWVAASYAVLLFALLINSFFHWRKSVGSMSVQPLGALLFAGYAVCWLGTPRFWNHAVAGSATRGVVK